MIRCAGNDKNWEVTAIGNHRKPLLTPFDTEYA